MDARFTVLYCTVHIEKMDNGGAGEPAIVFYQYLKRIAALLHIIAACRQGDWMSYLATLDNQIKYFFAAVELPPNTHT